MSNEFIISINKDSQGNQLSLDNITIEAAEALKIFIETLTDFAKQYGNNPDIKLVIKNGSISSCLYYPEELSTINKEINEVVEGKSTNNEKIRLFKAIQDKIQLNGLEYTVLHKFDNQVIDLTQAFKTKKFALKRSHREKVNVKVDFIKGKLYECGGKKRTNVHLENQIEEYKVECTRDQAMELNSRLYKEIYLAVLKTWKPGQKPLYNLIDNYLTEEKFEEYKGFYKEVRNNTTLEKHDLVYNKIVNIVENDDVNNGEILKIMRLYNYQESDRGIIRTILMTLKPVIKENRNLVDLYKSLADILREGSTNNAI